MGIIKSIFSGLGIGEPSQALQEEADRLCRQLVRAVADEDPQGSEEAIKRYFELLNGNSKLIGLELKNLDGLLANTASRLTTTRADDPVVTDFEAAHGLFWSSFTSLVETSAFRKTVKKNPAILRRVLPKMMRTALHFILNRRHKAFHQLIPALERLNARFPEIAGQVKLDAFFGKLHDLLPKQDSAVWLVGGKKPSEISPETTPLTEFDPQIIRAVSRVKNQEKLAKGIWNHVQEYGHLGIAKDMSEKYLDSLRRKVGDKNPLSFCDNFFLFSPTTTTHHNHQPALLIWYLEPDDKLSQIPEKFKGHAMAFRPFEAEGVMNFRISNLNFEAKLDNGFQAFSESSIATLTSDLLSSNGTYLVALLPINRMTVKAVWQQTGSIDFSGKLHKAIALLDQGKVNEGIPILEGLSRTNHLLTEADLILGIHHRSKATPEGYKVARECFQRVLEVDPGDFRALCHLGITCKMEGNLKEAIKFFELSFKSQPYFVENLVSYASALISLENPDVDRARKMFALGYHLNPRNENTLAFAKTAIDKLGIDFQEYADLFEIDTALH